MSHYGTSGINGYYTLNDMYVFATLYKAYSNIDEIYKTKNLLDEYCSKNTTNGFWLNSSNTSNSSTSNNDNSNIWLPNNFLPNNDNTWRSKVFKNQYGLEK